MRKRHAAYGRRLASDLGEKFPIGLCAVVRPWVKGQGRAAAVQVGRTRDLGRDVPFFGRSAAWDGRFVEGKEFMPPDLGAAWGVAEDLGPGGRQEVDREAAIAQEPSRSRHARNEDGIARAPDLTGNCDGPGDDRAAQLHLHVELPLGSPPRPGHIGARQVTHLDPPVESSARSMRRLCAVAFLAEKAATRKMKKRQLFAHMGR